jgi:hypothetical protein
MHAKFTQQLSQIGFKTHDLHPYRRLSCRIVSAADQEEDVADPLQDQESLSFSLSLEIGLTSLAHPSSVSRGTIPLEGSDPCLPN